MSGMKRVLRGEAAPGRGNRRRQCPERPHWRWNHTGGFPGSSKIARHRWDGVNYVVLCNKSSHCGGAIREVIDHVLDNTPIVWQGAPIPAGREPRR